MHPRFLILSYGNGGKRINNVFRSSVSGAHEFILNNKLLLLGTT